MKKPCDVCNKVRHIEVTLSKKEVFGAKRSKEEEIVEGNLVSKFVTLYNKINGKIVPIHSSLVKVESKHNWQRKTRLCKLCWLRVNQDE